MAKRDKKSRNRGSVGNNRKTGEGFLQKNAQKEGVVELPSGLQYKIIEKGSGAHPNEDSFITFHQRCLLLNGSSIIDTYQENKASEAKLSELLEGLQEGLLLMNKGARYKFFLPPELAWGKKGSSSRIPPNAVLQFDIRLIDFW